MVIDISSNNGNVKFSELTNVDLVIIRSSLGYGDFDKNLKVNAIGADNAGIPVGYYHFAYPHTGVDIVSDADKQANYFCDTISKLPTPKYLAVDLENFSAKADATLSQEDYAKWLQSFLDTVEYRTGIKCIIYSYADYLNRHLPDNHTFGTYQLWIANYGHHTVAPPLPKGWNGYIFWQYSETGEIVGVTGKVDLSKVG